MATAQINPEGHVPAIYASMQEVMKGIENIPKNGQMKFGQTSYSYLRADDVQDKLIPLLTQNNIVVAANYTTTEGERGNRQYVFVHLELTYISSVDGSRFPTIRSVGESLAGDDKSINKALTAANKNAHRMTFQFASGEAEPDNTSPSPAKTTKTSAAIDRAKKAPAKAETWRAKVKSDFLDTEKTDRDTVNALMKSAQEEGLKGDSIWEQVHKELSGK